ncbi:MAG TPA: DUF2341 domain-containing protein, partial [Chitinivibrionales bacterium]|nr:DUF2341 domain-containing protein [Chitinivibrionales bacterium]
MKLDRWNLAGVAAFAAMLGSGFAAYGAEDYTQWAHACNITLNTTATGANIATQQLGFPVLVRLTSATPAFSFAQAMAAGQDIRFSKSDGTHIPYQIERFDQANQVGEIWVKVDVNGNDNAQYISMYWGKAGSADSSNGASVFNNGFAGVWHLGEAGTGTRIDATGNGFNAIPFNYTGIESTAGNIAKADSLRGGPGQTNGGNYNYPCPATMGPPPTNDYLAIPSNIADWSAGMTFSVWANPSALVTQAPFMDFSTDTTGQCENWQATNNILFFQTNATGALGVQVFSDTVNQQTIAATGTPVVAGAWHQYAFTIANGSVATIYKDGAQIGAGTFVKGVQIPAAGIKPGVTRTWNMFGRSAWNGNAAYQGYLDEIEASTAVRSADWINLSYQSQKPGASWQTFVAKGLAAPVITVQPVSQTKSVGQPETLSVVVTGNPSPTYQWQKNGANIAGATNASYIIVAVALTDAGTYDVVVTNSQGTVTSAGAILTVNSALTPPTISTQPVSQTKFVGQADTFSVVASGNPAPTYQWQKNGANIAGATNASYIIAAVALTDAGTYDVVVANSQGSVTSAGATLTVNPALAAPAISKQPASQTKFVGQADTFSVVVSGNPAPTYQWQKNGANIAGATNASYIIAAVALTDAGTYDVVVTNSQGSVTSAGATLTVNPALTLPAITKQPLSQTKYVDQADTFSVVASGNPAPTYQWRDNGTNIAGATNASYIIASAALTDAGTYD